LRICQGIEIAADYAKEAEERAAGSWMPLTIVPDAVPEGDENEATEGNVEVARAPTTPSKPANTRTDPAPIMIKVEGQGEGQDEEPGLPPANKMGGGRSDNKVKPKAVTSVIKGTKAEKTEVAIKGVKGGINIIAEDNRPVPSSLRPAKATS
jgi:hypothetical protein